MGCQMILIYSALGATKNYHDQEMMKKTLIAFVNSVMMQTDKEFRLFLVGHDRPDFLNNKAVIWHSLSCDAENELTLIPTALPKSVKDKIEYRPEGPKGKLEDMSRKVRQGVIDAVLWAYKNRLEEFWLMRMDSDDLLAKDTVQRIHALDKVGNRAVYNKTCHMFDMKTGQIAVHYYPYSTTPNALKFGIKSDGTLIPDWFYLCLDHTHFRRRVKTDGILNRELDFTYCIVTNSGNSISGRETLTKVEHNVLTPLTNFLIKRYGIDKLL